MLILFIRSHYKMSSLQTLLMCAMSRRILQWPLMSKINILGEVQINRKYRSQWGTPYDQNSTCGKIFNLTEYNLTYIQKEFNLTLKQFNMTNTTQLVFVYIILPDVEECMLNYFWMCKLIRFGRSLMPHFWVGLRRAGHYEMCINVEDSPYASV